MITPYKKLTFFILFWLMVMQASAIHTITSFSPQSGYPRSLVTIVGTNLSGSVANVHVFFGNAKAQVLSATTDTIIVWVPFGATVAPITISKSGYTVSTPQHFVPSYPATTATPSNLDFFPTEGDLNLSYSGGQILHSYASADFDNDGRLDLLAQAVYLIGYAAASSVSPYHTRIRVIRNISGSGGGIGNAILDPNYPELVADSGVYSYKYSTIYGFTTGDMNSDGNLDIVARTDSGVVLFINKGTGFSHTMFTRILIEDPLLSISPYSGWHEDITLADFDNNGKIDIAATGPNSIVILSNNSIGTAINAANFTLNRIRTFQRVTNLWSVYSGHITDDDLPDLVIHSGSGINNDTLFFLQNTFGSTSTSLDSASFTGPTIMKLILQPRTTKICDLNNDTKLDVNTIFQNYNGFQSNLGGSVFTFAPISSIAQGAPLYTMLMGDLTGDGLPDVVTAWGGGIVVRRNNNVSTSTLNGSAFTSATFNKPIYGLQETANTLFDLDNDGRPDLVTTRQVIAPTGSTANLLISRNTYLLSSPTVSVSSASISSLTATSIKITINTPGNGTGRAVLIKAGTAAITSFPVNYTYYSATGVYGSSPTLSDGSKVVYVGDSNVVTINGLSASTAYKIAIVEMKGWANATTFLTSGVYTMNPSTLPVKWLSFEGNKINEGCMLNWQTASEINNNRFEVERSFIDGIWETAGSIKGSGTNTSLSQYNFVDKDPRLLANSKEYQTVFYRLKQIDFDGNYEYSSQISINLYQAEPGAEDLTVSVFPVPFSQQFNIKINEATSFDYTLIDGKGIEVKKGNSSTPSTQIDASELSEGIYLLRITTASNQTRTVKVVKGE